jgi:hypothetical protein
MKQAPIFITAVLAARGAALSPTASITANWLGESRDQWTVPVGGGFGKFFTIGKQAVCASAQGLCNVVTPCDGPDFTGFSSSHSFFLRQTPNSDPDQFFKQFR